MKKLSSIFLMLVIGTQATFAIYSAESKINNIFIYENSAVVSFKQEVINKRGSCKSSTRFYIDITTSGGIQMLNYVTESARNSRKIKVGYTTSKCSNIWGTNSMVKIYSVKGHYYGF